MDAAAERIAQRLDVSSASDGLEVAPVCIVPAVLAGVVHLILKRLQQHGSALGDTAPQLGEVYRRRPTVDRDVEAGLEDLAGYLGQGSDTHAGIEAATYAGRGTCHLGAGAEHLVQPFFPELIEEQTRAQGIQLTKSGVYARLDGGLAQETAGERVDGGNGRLVYVSQCLGQLATLVAGLICRIDEAAKVTANTQSELAGSLLRESDGDHAPDGPAVQQA